MTKIDSEKTERDDTSSPAIREWTKWGRRAALMRIAVDHILFWIVMIPTGVRIFLTLAWLRYFAPRGEADLDVPFGNHGCCMDKHRPPRRETAPPGIVVFVYGGAWGSGSRWNYTLFARELAGSTGYEVWVPDYRTWPAGCVDDMVVDVSEAIAAARAECARRGGGMRLVLVGHSAGAHLAFLTAMRRAGAGKSEQGSDRDRELLAGWDVRDLDVVIGLSGPYDITDHYAHEASRGVELVSPMARAMGGPSEFARLSPRITVRGLNRNHSDNMNVTLPRFVVVHGLEDEVVPPSSSGKVHDAIVEAGHLSEHIQLPGVGHNQLVVSLMSRSHPVHKLVLDTLRRTITDEK